MKKTPTKAAPAKSSALSANKGFGTLAWGFKQSKMDNEAIFGLLLQIRHVDPRIRQMAAEYEGMSERARRSASVWDDLCLRHDYPASKLFGLIAEAAFVVGRATTNMLLAQSEPEVIKKLIEFASKEENTEDRENLLRVSGALKRDGGVTVNTQIGVKVEAQTQQRGLPSVEDLTQDSTRLVREHRQRMLTEGTGFEGTVGGGAKREVVDAEYEVVGGEQIC